MSLRPYRFPGLSNEHRRLLVEAAGSTGPFDCNAAYKKFRESDGRRYRDASEDHCVYCGSRSDRLDIDHFHAKGSKPKVENVRVGAAGTRGGNDNKIAALTHVLHESFQLFYQSTAIADQPSLAKTRAIAADALLIKIFISSFTTTHYIQ